MQMIRLFAAIAIAACFAFLLWWLADRPQQVTAEWRQPLASLSFSPYRRGQSPVTKIYPSAEQVEQDLRRLVGLTQGVRTYTSSEGAMGILPGLAAKMGLKLTLGAWLGRDAAQNEIELTSLIRSANEHPESVQRVIVGNEVMLRGDLPPDQLIAAIRRVKAAIRQPVSTADVWSFYLKNPEIVAELDYLTIHILPFWEDQPVSLDDLEAHTVHIVELIRKTFPGKPVLIGETGWPSIGRDRGPAAVNQINQARFVREMANIAARHGFDYNIFEAFDTPWQAADENTVGGAWGILDEAREAKFPMIGPVLMVPDWRRRALCALCCGALAAVFFGYRIRKFGSLLVMALIAQILGWLLISTVFHCLAVTFLPWQNIWLVARIGLPGLIMLSTLARCRDWLHAARPAKDFWQGQVWQIIAAFYAIFWTFLLLFDGRYRDIPEFDFSVAVGSILLMVALRLVLVWRQGGAPLDALDFQGLFPGSRSRITRALAWLLPLAAVAALASEAFALESGRDFVAEYPSFADQVPLLLTSLVWNREMDLWAVMLVVWSIPFLTARLRFKTETPA